MMVDLLDDGYDIVCGWRRERRDPWLTRRLPSNLANWLISRTTGVKLHDYGLLAQGVPWRVSCVRCGSTVRCIGSFRPLPASREYGSRRSQSTTDRGCFGTSKYGLSRTMRVILDLFTVKFLLSYSTQPIQVFGPPGLLMGMAGVAITA